MRGRVAQQSERPEPGRQDPKDAEKKIVEKHRYDTTLLLRLLERRLKEWRPGEKVERSLSLTKNVNLTMTEAEMVDVGETLAKALPGGLGSALREVLGRQRSSKAGTVAAPMLHTLRVDPVVALGACAVVWLWRRRR